MILEQLRTATAEAHEGLEQRLFPYLENITAPEEYVRLLKAFYGFVKPVQELIYNQVEENMSADLDERRNADLILADLEEMDSEDAVQLCDKLPDLSTQPRAFGALYVLEGSTLGGKIIANTLAAKLPPPHALRFFRGYGSETGIMWKRFIAQLENPALQGKSEEVIAGAADTFDFFDKWLSDKL